SRQGRSFRVPAKSADSAPRRNVVREMAAAQDIHLYLEELAGSAAPVADAGAERLWDLVRHTALLQVLADAAGRPGEERVLLYVWTANPSGAGWAGALAKRYAAARFSPGFRVDLYDEDDEYGAAHGWGLETKCLPLPASCPGHAFLVEGLGARALTRGE